MRCTPSVKIDGVDRHHDVERQVRPCEDDHGRVRWACGDGRSPTRNVEMRRNPAAREKAPIALWGDAPHDDSQFLI